MPDLITDWLIPAGLSKQGRAAAKAIVEFLTEHGMTDHVVRVYRTGGTNNPAASMVAEFAEKTVQEMNTERIAK